MTDDISKVIEAVAKLTSLAGTTVPQVTKMVAVPIETKIQSAITAQTVLTNLLQSQQDEYTLNQQLALLSADIGTEQEREKYKDKVTEMMKTLKDNVKNRGNKMAKAFKKGAKSKITKIIEQLDKMSERLEKINEKIDKLLEEKAKLEEKKAKILSSTSAEQDQIKKEDEENAKKNKENEKTIKKLTKEQLIEKKRLILEDQKRRLIAKKVELKCKMARLLALNSENDKLCDLAGETQDETFQSLAELPINMIKTIDALIDFILFLISGVMSPQDEDMDIIKMIKDILAMINPVLMSMMKLPVPEVPGLKELPQIMKILETVAKPMTASDDEIAAKIQDVPSLPGEFLPMIGNIFSAVVSMTGGLFMALFNLIFQMIKSIISLFEQIAGVLGIPKIPFPLSLIPDIIKMLPDITQLIIMAPIQIPTIVTKIIIDKVREIQYLQIPDTIKLDNILPEDFEMCEKHKKEELENNFMNSYDSINSNNTQNMA